MAQKFMNGSLSIVENNKLNITLALIEERHLPIKNLDTFEQYSEEELIESFKKESVEYAEKQLKNFNCKEELRALIDSNIIVAKQLLK